MNQPDLSYEYSLKHSYLRIAGIPADEEDFELKMLTKSDIPDIIPPAVSRSGEEMLLQYDISGLETMEKHYEHCTVSAREISAFIYTLDSLLTSLESYLLPDSLVFLDPGTVFIHPETGSFRFTLIPGRKDNFAEALAAFLTYVLKKIDYSCDSTLVLAYKLCQKASGSAYCMDDLIRIVDSSTEKPASAALPPSGAAVRSAAHSAAASVSVPAPAKDTAHTLRIPPVSKEADKPDSAEMNPADTAAETEINLFGNSAACGADAVWDAEAETEELQFSRTEKKKLFGILPVPGKLLSFGEAAPESKKAAADTVSAQLKIDTAEKSMKGKLLLAVSFMILLPLLLYFLKGAAVFQRLFPIILVLETGALVILLLDCLMAKLPEN